MQLRDEGALSLQDHVGVYEPAFSDSPIRIDHLLTHTSGLQDRRRADGRTTGAEAGFESLLTLYPEAGLAIAVLGNKQDWPRFKFEQEIMSRLLKMPNSCTDIQETADYGQEQSLMACFPPELGLKKG